MITVTTVTSSARHLLKTAAATVYTQQDPSVVKGRARDIAYGILIAQKKGGADEAVEFRNVMENPLIKHLPHDDKMATLREYVHMASTPEFEGHVNLQTPLVRRIYQAAKSTLADSAMGAGAGAAAVLMTTPNAFQEAFAGKAARRALWTNSMKKPVIASAAIAGALQASKQYRDTRAERAYTKAVNDVIGDLSQMENPNPYLTALLLTNASELDSMRRGMAASEDRRLSSLNSLSTAAASIDPTVGHSLNSLLPNED